MWKYDGIQHTYIMLLAFLDMEKAWKLLSTSIDTGEQGIEAFILSDDEWDYLDRLKDVFQIFQPIITKLSAQSYPLFHNVVPSYVLLKNQLEYFIQ
jgi:hypothetical protein